MSDVVVRLMQRTVPSGYSHEYCIIAGGTVYNGFICHVDGLCDDTTLRPCVGHKYAFFISKEEFRKTIDISGPDLYTPFCNDLFVMWQWTVGTLRLINNTSSDAAGFRNVEVFVKRNSFG